MIEYLFCLIPGIVFFVILLGISLYFKLKNDKYFKRSSLRYKIISIAVSFLAIILFSVFLSIINTGGPDTGRSGQAVSGQ